LDKERATLVERRRARGDADVTVGLSLNPTGARTSLIVDPPDGRIPALTPEAKKATAADREFRLALSHARTSWRPARAGNTIQPPRRDARNLLLATSRTVNRASIATMVRRTATCRTAA
jgi:hypothetical protein